MRPAACATTVPRRSGTPQHPGVAAPRALQPPRPSASGHPMSGFEQVSRPSPIRPSLHARASASRSASAAIWAYAVSRLSHITESMGVSYHLKRKACHFDVEVFFPPWSIEFQALTNARISAGEITIVPNTINSCWMRNTPQPIMVISSTNGKIWDRSTTLLIIRLM